MLKIPNALGSELQTVSQGWSCERPKLRDSTPQNGRLAAAEAERTPAAEGIPEDLMALYERLRGAKNGVGAAELRARQCGGCHITIDAAELAQIKRASADEVVRCEECQRILVRTSEAGV